MLPLIALFGPTGVGKTAVAIALAELLRARGEDPVAVSADSLQVYAGLEVLTGAATALQRARLEHRLLGFLGVTERCSAGVFAHRAHAEIDMLLAEGRRPIVVGGTGLYLRAALAELELRPPGDPAVREHWRARIVADGPEAVHAELAARAPAVAAGVAPTDTQRLIRVHELLDAGHEPPPPANATGSELWTTATRHPTLLVGLTLDREVLAQRIDARVDAMVAAGAIDEVRRADAAGASPGARQALGFAELLADDVDAMKARTRRYAKRQLTWMRKLAGATLIDVTGRPPEDVAAEVQSAADALARA